MIKNLGLIDRIIRVLTGLIVLVLYLAGQISGTAAIILGIIGAVLALTAFIGTCPIYLALKISTYKKLSTLSITK